MSRCKACNAILTPSEMVAKDDNGDFRDTCGRCTRLGSLYDDPEDAMSLLPVDAGVVDYG